MASGLPLIVPDEGGCAEIADPLTAELYTARDAQSAAAAIGRLFARDEKLLRRAAVLAAAKVRTDREHTIDLMDYYGDLVAAKRGGRAVSAA
jgi:alpha-1,6-mannosyltransferase